MSASNAVAGGPATSWRKAMLRWAWLSLAIAVALETAQWLMPGSAQEWLGERAADGLFYLYTPAFLVIIGVSGNPHYFSDALAFPVFTLQNFLMIFPLGVAVIIARHLRRRRRSRAYRS